MEQTDLLRYVINALERLGIVHMIVGSMASSAYGESRLTQDIDIVLELPASQIKEFCAQFPAPEFYVSESAVRDAVRDRFQFNILHPTSGNKIDFIFPSDDAWGRTQLGRRQRVRVLPNQVGFTASPLDVIIGKLRYFAEGGSDKHLRDITGILRISGDKIDRDEVARWAALLGLNEIWIEVAKRADESSK